MVMYRYFYTTDMPLYNTAKRPKKKWAFTLNQLAMQYMVHLVQSFVAFSIQLHICYNHDHKL